MRWIGGGRGSVNVQDRRGFGGGGLGLPRGFGGGGPLMRGGLGTLVVGALVLWLSGANLGSLLGLRDGGTTGSVAVTAEEREQEQVVRLVLGSTEEVWGELFRLRGKTYREPTLVLFRDHVASACGTASSAVGPFYCPGDRQIYLDLGFFTELARRHRAPGDFAQAYVVAHEVGHHVQGLLGISDKVRAAQQRARGEAEENRLSVRLELQADCLAGVWAHHAQKKGLELETGDLEEAIRAAEAIGDDALQKRARGHVVPDSFTHGTSAQRIAWFRHGLTTGSIDESDTFDEAIWTRVNSR
jgi:predicted metalloprotease